MKEIYLKETCECVSTCTERAPQERERETERRRETAAHLGNKLDVLVLTYNRSRFLKIQLQSLCEQTLQGFKITVLNNCSTDDTLQVIEEIKEEYPLRDIQVITNEKNLGNPGNFIRSQSIPTREYVAVFHDDDAVHPEYLERAMSVLVRDSNIVMASGGAGARYNVDEHNMGMLPNVFIHYPAANSVFYQLICARPTFCIAIYRTNVYKKTEYHPERYGKLHDIVFMMDVGRQGEIALLQGECVRWRQYLNSDSNSLSSGPFTDEILSILSYIYTQLESYTCRLGKLKRILHRALSKTLLFNFAFFLYNWAALSRFLTWETFRESMIEEQIFTEREYKFFDRYIDKICNPMVRKKAVKYWTACAKTYEFRVNGQ